MLWTLASKCDDKWVQFPVTFETREEARQVMDEFGPLLPNPENLRVQAANLLTMRRPISCLLCKIRKTDRIGLWIPDPQTAKRIGEPKGKNRLIFYALCDDCFDLPDKKDRADEILIRDLQVN
jgi:hypothetical protein